MDLVGRDTQLQTVQRALDDVRAGRSRVLVVVGEPGIGKTALLEAAAERAGGAGLLTLAGRAAEHEREVPFALAVAALDDHVSTLHPRRVETLGPELGAILPAAANGHAPHPPTAAAAPERFRYHRALRSLLELLTRERPLALLLDDLHWADDASIEFIQHLLRRPPRSPYLLILALRAPSVLMETAVPRNGTEYVYLDPLDHQESLALLHQVPDAGLRERIAREARGNPFFLDQLTRVDGDTLPPCVLAAINGELASLPPGARALLEGAAVAGDPFDPELAATAAELEDVAGPLDQLAAAGVVQATGNGRGFAFRHSLVRRAVYDGAPPAWRLGRARADRGRARRARDGAGRAGPPRRGVRADRRRGGDRAADRGGRRGGRDRPGHVRALVRRGAGAGAGPRHASGASRCAPPKGCRWARPAACRRVATCSSRCSTSSRRSRRPQRLELVAACAGMEELMGLAPEARRRLLIAYATAPAPAKPFLALQLASVASCYGSPRPAARVGRAGQDGAGAGRRGGRVRRRRRPVGTRRRRRARRPRPRGGACARGGRALAGRARSRSGWRSC